MSPRDKLLRLLKEKRISRAEIAKPGKISYGAMMTYLQATRPRMPSVDRGIEIAKRLEVPAEWLWSDDDWPPPQSFDLRAISDAPLMQEIIRRKQVAASEFEGARTAYLALREEVRRLTAEFAGDGPKTLDRRVDKLLGEVMEKFLDSLGLFEHGFTQWLDFRDRLKKIDQPIEQTPEWHEMQLALAMMAGSRSWKGQSAEAVVVPLMQLWRFPAVWIAKVAEQVAVERQSPTPRRPKAKRGSRPSPKPTRDEGREAKSLKSGT